MARRSAVVVVALAVALAAVLLHPAAAAGQKRPATGARREDVPYIRCQVCERIAREISERVAGKQQALPPSRKVPEIEIIEIAENVCNLKKQEADWMLRRKATSSSLLSKMRKGIVIRNARPLNVHAKR